MDLIDRIIETLSKSGLKAPSFDIHFDTQNNVIGYVTDEIFENLDDKESQHLIWDSLRKHFGQDDLLKILTIFHETPKERAERLIGYNSKSTAHSNFWLHTTPDLTKYWLFIDVAKFGDDYKTFFLVVNQKENFKKGLTYVYNKEVIEFMELAVGEIYAELFSNTFNNAESEIKYHLITRHDRLSDKGLRGNANMFNYVFDKFVLKPISKNRLIFTDEEIPILIEALEHIENFEVKKDIEIAIKKSDVMNKSRIQF